VHNWISSGLDGKLHERIGFFILALCLIGSEVPTGIKIYENVKNGLLLILFDQVVKSFEPTAHSVG